MADVDPKVEALRKWILGLFQALPRVTYYQLLGVPPDSLEPQLRAAYYKMVGRLHPDMYRGLLDSETSRRLVSVYSHLVEAYRVLTDGRRREQYDKGLTTGKLRWTAEDERGPKKGPQNPNAKRFLKLGESSLLAGDWKSAIMNLKLALSVEPDDPTTKAALAKAEAMSRGTPT